MTAIRLGVGMYSRSGWPKFDRIAVAECDTASSSTSAPDVLASCVHSVWPSVVTDNASISKLRQHQYLIVDWL